jgi:hypothetical protein
MLNVYLFEDKESMVNRNSGSNCQNVYQRILSGLPLEFRLYWVRPTDPNGGLSAIFVSVTGEAESVPSNWA